MLGCGGQWGNTAAAKLQEGLAASAMLAHQGAVMDTAAAELQEGLVVSPLLAHQSELDMQLSL